MNVGNISIDFIVKMKNMEDGFKKANKLITDFNGNKKSRDVIVNFTANTDKLKTGTAEAIKTVENAGKEGNKAGQKVGEEIGEGIGEGIERSVSSIDFTRAFTNMFSKMEDIAKKGIKRVTLPIVAAGTRVWKMSANFEDAMAKVDTIADTSMKSLAELKKEALDVSNLTGISAKDVASGQYGAMSAGIDTDKASQFTQVAGISAKAGFTDLDTSIDGLTSVVNAYNLEAEHAMAISDQMLMAQQKGKITFGEMSQYMGNAIPIASNLNVSTQELFTSFAVLTKNAIKPRQAITGLKSALDSVMSPSESAAKTAEALGIEFNAAHLKSVGFTQFLEEIKEKTQGSEVALSQLFGSTEAVSAIFTLTGAGAEDFANILDDVTNSAGATEEAYNKLQTPQAKLEISIERLKNAFLRFGEALIPAIEMITEKMNEFAEKINQMSPEAILRITEIAMAFALFFPAMLIVAKLGTAVMAIGKGISWVAGIAAKAGPMIGNSVGGGFTVGTLATMGLVAAIGLFVGVLWNAEDESTITTQSIGDKFRAFGERVAGVFDFVGAILHSIISLFVSGVSILIEKGLDKLMGFLSAAQDIADGLGLDWLSDKLGNGVDNLDSAIKKMKETRKDLTGKSLELLDDAMYKMDNPMDSIMDKQVKTGKFIVEGEIAGNKVSFVGKENNKHLFDDKGRLKKNIKEDIEKQRNKKREWEGPSQEDMFKEMEDLELPEWKPMGTPDMSEFFGKDDKLDKLDKVNKKLPAVKKEVDKTTEAINKLGEEFRRTADKIKGSIGMFDRFKSRATSSYRLLRNAEEREKAFALRDSTLQGLSQKGLNSDIMKDLYNTDMGQLGDLQGLNRMSQEQLEQWSSAQSRASQSADRQAMEQTVYVTIDAKNNNFDEVERELTRRLKLKGVTL